MKNNKLFLEGDNKSLNSLCFDNTFLLSGLKKTIRIVVCIHI